jgi:nicotinate-nucleotide adenylyltransferase
MNIGVLGGTFDPVHNGHLILAEAVMARLNLTEVVFVPAGQPWMKTDRAVTPAEHRLRMLRLALAGKPGFRLSAMEIERAGPTYTIDTIAELCRRLLADDVIYFVLGQDSLAGLPQWHDASTLIQMLLDEPHVDISASDIRDRLARGLSVRHLVPEPVNRYIKEHGLYVA